MASGGDPGSLTQSLMVVVLLVAALAALPWAARTLRNRMAGLSGAAGSAELTIRAAVAVGPHQRVIAVEAGPNGQRRQLLLGVSPSGIVCLSEWVEPSAVVAGPGATVAAKSANAHA